MTALGAQSGYQAEVSINGHDGAAHVFRMPGSVTETVATLERRFAPIRFAYDGGTMAIGTAVVGRLRQFMIVLRTDLADHSIVMTVSVDGLGDAPPEKPARHLLGQVPAFPGGAPTFFAHDREAGMRLAVATTSSAPEDVQRFYAQSLPADGWKPALPAGAAGSRDFHVYLKDREICGVFASASPATRETRITVLHKEPGRDK